MSKLQRHIAAGAAVSARDEARGRSGARSLRLWGPRVAVAHAPAGAPRRTARPSAGHTRRFRADACARAQNGWSALHLAARGSHADAVSALLAAGADAHAVNTVRQSVPSHTIARSERPAGVWRHAAALRRSRRLPAGCTCAPRGWRKRHRGQQLRQGAPRQSRQRGHARAAGRSGADGPCRRCVCRHALFLAASME